MIFRACYDKIKLFSLIDHALTRLQHSSIISSIVVKSARYITSTNMDISGMRQPYNDRSNLLLEENLEVKEPFFLFEKWFKEVKDIKAVAEPNAVCLATATKSGLPSVRYMLCKGFDKSYGFKLFTNFESRKGKELEENPNAALTFYWEPLSRSVRIEGTVEKLSVGESEEYFKSRPHNSQIGALTSQQSRPVASRKTLEDREKELLAKYKEGEVPKPESWGGFLVIPHTFEFWQGQTGRLHDRIKFRKLKDGEQINEEITHIGEEGWVYERLNP